MGDNNRPINADFVSWLSSILQRYERAGAVVVMVPPVSPRSNYDVHYDSRIAAALDSIGWRYAVAPREMTVPDSMSFDGGYHVTRAGAELCTRRLLQALKQVKL